MHSYVLSIIHSLIFMHFYKICIVNYTPLTLILLPSYVPSDYFNKLILKWTGTIELERKGVLNLITMSMYNYKEAD